ncbi:hypothetical protein J6TS1_04750 [Siminovitchia terrae]|uniref:Uncharacterized protein n=1 Tax=Siminovitchia terrae TaxID=1914933 RepID=A0ABQ4KT04_SIMTE|nr:hypothetical protein J22TS1_25100 [Siminovitchia terrae]GIN94605.1 hypothetical protein J6TS1_04750 [Siminovitchia terrae]
MYGTGLNTVEAEVLTVALEKIYTRLYFDSRNPDIVGHWADHGIQRQCRLGKLQI